MFKDAIFVSMWDGGTMIVSPCTVNMETREVFDIVTVCCGELDTLDDEHIEIDGVEYPVFRFDDLANKGTAYWYK